MGYYLTFIFTPFALLFMGVALVVAAVATLLLRRQLKTVGQKVLFFLLLLAVAAIIQVTLFRIPPAGLAVPQYFDWGIGRLSRGLLGTEVLLNIFLFVPASFLATLLWKHPFRVTGIGVLFSLAIESLQPVIITGGVNDVMDLFANSFGAWLGSLLGWTVFSIIELLTRRVKVAELLKVLIAAVVTAAVVFGGSALGAVARQSAIIAALEANYAGTTLADFTTIEETLFEKVQSGPGPDNGNYSYSYSDETIGKARYATDFFFIESCVIATWDADSFTTERIFGGDCSKRLG